VWLNEGRITKNANVNTMYKRPIKTHNFLLNELINKKR
jgi:hypothetical protein